MLVFPFLFLNLLRVFHLEFWCDNWVACWWCEDFVTLVVLGFVCYTISIHSLKFKIHFSRGQWNFLWISQMGIQSDFDCSLHTRYALRPLNKLFLYFTILMLCGIVYEMLKWEYNQILDWLKNCSLHTRYALNYSLSQCIPLFYTF